MIVVFLCSHKNSFLDSFQLWFLHPTSNHWGNTRLFDKHRQQIIIVMIRRPLLAGAIRLRGMVLQSEVRGHKSQVFFRSKITNIIIKPVSDRFPVSNVVFTGLQVSKLGFTGLLLYPLDKGFTTQHPGSRNLGWVKWDPEIHQNFKVSPIHLKTTKLVSKDLQECPKRGLMRDPKSSNLWKSQK